MLAVDTSKSQCQFYLKKKKRYCKFPKVQNENFCHAHVLSTSSERRNCPVDASHTILKKNTMRHVLSCPLVRDEAYKLLQPFTCENINLPCPPVTSSSLTTPLNSFSNFVQVQRNHLKKEILSWDIMTENKLSEVHMFIDDLYKKSCVYLEKSCCLFLNDFAINENDCANTSSSNTVLPFLEKLSLNQRTPLLKLIMSQMPSHAKDENWIACDNGPKWLELLDNLENKKHRLQHICLMAKALNMKCFDKSHAIGFPLVCVEFGAGRGGLTQGLASFFKDRQDVQYVLIDKEKRRHLCEHKKLENASVDHNMKEQSVTRLRVNIVDFDLQKFLLYMENPDSVSCDPEFKQVPYLLQYLEALKCLPLKSKARHWDQSSIITQLSQLAGIPACHRLNTLKTQLYHRFKCNSSRFSSLHSPRRLSCFCFAKHLCGSATDYALQSIVVGNRPPSRLSSMTVLIATCCHHRTTWKDCVGRFWLTDYLNLTEESFHQIINLSGWATGAKGLKQLVGLKVKRVIDISRVAFLRQNGFPYSTLEPFIGCGSDTTLENIVIKASTYAMS